MDKGIDTSEDPILADAIRWESMARIDHLIETFPGMDAELQERSTRLSELVRLISDLPRAQLDHAVVKAATRGIAAQSQFRAMLRDYQRPPADRTTLPPQPASEPPDALPQGVTEDSIALRFSRENAVTWCYVAAWGAWLHWDGSRWAREGTLEVFDLVRQTCREVAAECAEAGASSTKRARISTAAVVSSVERLARYDRRHAKLTEEFDALPMSLNTPAGTIDLTTGAVGKHDLKAMHTKTAGANLGAEESGAWVAFLKTITNDDADMQAYLRRVVGYCLTGSTNEHVLFFLHGTGANGKSVFLNTLAAVMGDYAANAPSDTFLDTKMDKHPTDIAGLKGSRLVTASEVERGRRWAEAKIKSLTGGDRITARFMRQDFFTFKPEFKIMIAGNHRPGLRDVGEATRRRLHMIPFEVTIPQEQRVQNLLDILLMERDGIMRWAVNGALEWQRGGLQPPKSVIDSTEEYMAEEDTIARWIDECCAKEPQARSQTADLFKSWSEWAERNGEYVGSLRRLTSDLVSRGYSYHRDRTTRALIGIRINREQPSGGEELEIGEKSWY